MTLAGGLVSCGGQRAEVASAAPIPEVGVVKVVRQNLGRTLVVSAELVPFQVSRSQEDPSRLESQQKVTHLEYTRLDGGRA